jgi:hypothetical protein
MPPSIDTLINTFSLFAQLILATFEVLGGLILARCQALLQRAQKAVNKAEEAVNKVEEKVTGIEAAEKNMQAMVNQVISALIAINEKEQRIQKKEIDLQIKAEQLESMEKKISALLFELEQGVHMYKNSLRSSANSFPLVSANGQSVNLTQPTYPLHNSAVYGSASVQPLTLSGSFKPPLTTTGVQSIGTVHIDQGLKIKP